MTQFDMGFDYSDWDLSELMAYAVVLAGDIGAGRREYKPLYDRLQTIIRVRRRGEDKC